MLSRRSIRTVPAILLLIAFQGAGIVLITDRFGARATVLAILLVPLLLLVVPSALQQAAGEFRTFRREWTWRSALWLLVFLSGLVFRSRDVEAIKESAIDFWAGYRIMLVGIVALVLVVRLVLGKTRLLKFLARGPICAMALYILICAVSTLWSVYPAWTLYKSAELFVDITLVAAILTHARSTEDFKGLFDCTWAICVACLGTIWVGVIAWPEEAVFHDIGLLGMQIQGVLPTISANGVGDVGAVVALMVLCRLQSRNTGESRRALYFLLLAISIVTLVLSQARSPASGFLLASALILFLSSRLGPIAFLVLIAVLLLSYTSAADVLWTFVQRGQNPEVFRSLSGRMQWWTVGWHQFVQHPLTGYGAYAGTRFVALAQLGETGTSSIHNTYFEVLLGTGILGLIPFLVTLVGAWRLLVGSILRTSPGSIERQLIIEAAGLLAYGTARSFLTSALIWHPDLTFLQVLGYSEFLRRRRARGRLPLRRAHSGYAAALPAACR